MSFTFAYLTGYVTDFQLGQGSAIMELIEYEDVWFRSIVQSLDRIDVTLYNYGKADVKVLSVYLDGLQANFTNTYNDVFLTLAIKEHGSIRIYPPQSLDKDTVKIRIVTERGSAFDGQFTIPSIPKSGGA